MAPPARVFGAGASNASARRSPARQNGCHPRNPALVRPNQMKRPCYKCRGDFEKARAHAQAALHRAENPPAWYVPDPELLVDLKDEIARLDRCVQAGRLVD